MSVRLGLLALLAEGPHYGAELKSAFEQRTGGTWPVNVGQVYTTLDRLVRDGLAVAGPADADGRIRYSLTPAGRAAVGTWWRTPVDRAATPRDELVIKLAIAITSPGWTRPRSPRRSVRPPCTGCSRPPGSSSRSTRAPIWPG